MFAEERKIEFPDKTWASVRALVPERSFRAIQRQMLRMGSVDYGGAPEGEAGAKDRARLWAAHVATLDSALISDVNDAIRAERVLGRVKAWCWEYPVTAAGLGEVDAEWVDRLLGELDRLDRERTEAETRTLKNA